MKTQDEYLISKIKKIYWIRISEHLNKLRQDMELQKRKREFVLFFNQKLAENLMIFLII